MHRTTLAHLIRAWPASFLQQWDKAELCGVIVGTGVGKAFCAGGDIACSLAVLLGLNPHSRIWSPGVIENVVNDTTRPEAVEFFQREYESNTHHTDFP
jgi:3-hydroxyisobutyryl-CoA hydrolase